MKRAWTKKVKSLPSSVIDKDALEGQLQPHPKVKRQIFRTSAAVIGLTVSIGTPNFLLTQAAQMPEGMNSQSAPTMAAAIPATEQTNLAAETTYDVIPTPEVTPYQASVPLAYEPSIPSPPTVKKRAVHSYNQPAPVVQTSVPDPSFTPELQPSSQVVAPLVVEQDVRAILRQQQQQAASLEQTPDIAPPMATSQTSSLVAQLKANQQAEIANAPAVEVVPTQEDADVRPLTVRSPEVAINPEVNSAWTAKQRLLVARLKNQQVPTPANNEAAVPVSTPVIAEAVVQAPIQVNVESTTTTSQPTVVALPSAEQELPQQPPKETPEIAANSEKSMEFAVQTVPTEAMVLPATAPINQDSTANSERIVQPLPEVTALEPSTQKLQPVFVLPEASMAQKQVDITPIEEKIDEQKVATRNKPEIDDLQVAVDDTPKGLENTTPTKESIVSVNEPIIVTPTTSEYQVKPGDTLTTIASAHHLSLPEIANSNNLPNPNLLLVDQKLKIPALTSMKAQANVVVLPPIEKVEPLAEANTISAPTLQPVNKVELVSTEQKTVPENVPAQAYTGVGGDISDAEAETKPLDKIALNKLQAQYAQNLQNDVQKLQRKYYAQNSSNGSVVSAQTVEGDRLPIATKPSLNLNNEPVNPDFRVAQTFQDLKPLPQQQLVNRVKSSTSVSGRVATAPTGMSSSDDSLLEQQVTPELPPLAPALNYLPQPNGESFNGYMWPAKGVLTSPYGFRWGRMHKGIDIAAPVGTPVFAAAPGVVIKAGWNKGGYGNLVDIQHADGTLTRYAHNYRLLVQPGQVVEQGQQISLMGSTGHSTGPHLHFEVHPGGKSAVNPIAFLPKDR